MKRFSESEIFKIMKESDSGISLDELTRKYGFKKGTFYSWRKKYGGMELSEMKRLKELEEENRKLKTMYANLSLENHAMRELIEKKL